MVDSDNVLDAEVRGVLGSPIYIDGPAGQPHRPGGRPARAGHGHPRLGGRLDGRRRLPNGEFSGELTAPPQEGQTQESISFRETYRLANAPGIPYGLQITLANPYTFRASTIANVTGLLLVTGAIGLALSVVVAAFLALRFATPLRRLSEAARRIGEGDLASRVPLEEATRRQRRDRRGRVASSTRWPTGSRRASRSSATIATGAASSWPTSATS